MRERLGRSRSDLVVVRFDRDTRPVRDARFRPAGGLRSSRHDDSELSDEGVRRLAVLGGCVVLDEGDGAV